MTRVSRASHVKQKTKRSDLCFLFAVRYGKGEPTCHLLTSVLLPVDSTNSSTNSSTNHHHHHGTTQNKMEIMEASIEAINIGLDDDKLDDEEIEREVQVRWNIIMAS